MAHKEKQVSNVVRFFPEVKQGLSDEQIKQRQQEGLVNKTIPVVGKTYWEIIRDNVFSFFSILLFVIFGFIVYSNVCSGTSWYKGTFFITVLCANIIIGLYQDLHAKKLMKKMKLITNPRAVVIRNGQEVTINPEDIVLDDILVINSGDQIVSDSIVLEGNALVNESLLTGESLNIAKNKGDMVLSGTFSVGGRLYARVEKVGKDNYVETLAVKAKAFKKNPSHIIKSFKRLFHTLGYIVIGTFLLVTIIYAAQGSFNTKMDFINSIMPISGQLVAMIPAGLYLLTSMALATSVLSLARKNANVQDLYSVEMLARADVLCVDKTGTITDGTMRVKQIIPLSIKESEEDIEKIIAAILEATGDNNSTAKALKQVCVSALKEEIIASLPFSSDNKYSGVSFAGGMTYIIGASEYINVIGKEDIIKQGEEYTSKGYRLLLLARGKTPIEGNKYEKEVSPVAFIVIKDHVKEDAVETFKWFKENNVDIKVISGDNAVTVSEIAKEAGIAHADHYISLDGKSLEEVEKLATEYSVFGRVTPEQKEVIVMALKKAGHTVAMTGDGVNDILALKRADCSIAMNNGAQAAKNISHVVLMTNNFASMPSIVGEGRRVINNLQRTGSLFLTKTFFAIFMSLLFLIVSLSTHNRFSYPFNTNNMLIWENLGIGLSAFFIALEPNSTPINKSFLRNIMKKALPASILIICSVLACYALYALQELGVVYTGVSTFGYSTAAARELRGGATGMAVIIMSIFGMCNLIQVSHPFTKYRAVVSAICIGGAILALVLGFALGGKNIFMIDFDALTYENLIAIAAIVIVVAGCSVFIPRLQKTLKKEK